MRFLLSSAAVESTFVATAGDSHSGAGGMGANVELRLGQGLPVEHGSTPATTTQPSELEMQKAARQLPSPMSPIMTGSATMIRIAPSTSNVNPVRIIVVMRTAPDP